MSFLLVSAKHIKGASKGIRSDRLFSTVSAPTKAANAYDWNDVRTYERTLAASKDAYTLPGAVYHDPDFFKMEQEMIFKRGWTVMGETSAAPQHGDLYPSSIGGQSFVVANSRGTRRAFHNVCRHRGAQLVQCAGRHTTISCPYHKWGYALDGRLMGTPHWDTKPTKEMKEACSTKHVSNFKKEDFGLLPLRTEEWGGLVFGNISGDAPSLRSQLGDIDSLVGHYPWAEMVPAATKTYHIKANWKLCVENFAEYYHLPAVHPALCGVSTVANHKCVQGQGKYMAFGTVPLTNGGTSVDPDKWKAFPGISEEDQNAAWHCGIFPNVFFSVYPHHVFRVIIEPVAPGLTIERGTLLVHKTMLETEEGRQTAQGFLGFMDNVNAEDIDIIEKVQVGTMSEAYDGGRFSFKFEEAVHRFQSMISEGMLASPRVSEADIEQSFMVEEAAEPLTDSSETILIMNKRMDREPSAEGIGLYC